ncbi:Hypothetical protein D9617_18g034630 [Elsinoe fawcettii]|nr:Hypothetical protein D9617_18g034630 [Elsinoe fawcettii]
MLSRHNQENLSHTHLTAAASKPLNASSLPKTPFRSSKHDENAVFTTKATQKPNLFATPAARPRAVLGAKTTNAKALGTPGQQTKPQHQQPSAQKISPRLKRTKVRIHAPSPELRAQDPDADVPEPEYCPPSRILTPPLPDVPEDGLQGLIDSGLFTHENVMRTAFRPMPWSEADHEREERKHNAKAERLEEQLNAALERDGIGLLPSENGTEARNERKIGTLEARNAARMLGGTNDRKMPSFAAPTKSTKLRAEATGMGKENVNDKFMSAKAASKTTMGYSRGRQVSATKRAPLSNAHRAPVLKAAPKKEEGKGRKLEDVLKPATPVVDEEEVEIDWVNEEIAKLACEDFVLELEE